MGFHKGWEIYTDQIAALVAELRGGGRLLGAPISGCQLPHIGSQGGRHGPAQHNHLAGGRLEADLLYIAPMTERPHSYTYDPPPGVPRTNTVNAAHRVTVHDARLVAAGLSLDREGFELVEQHSAVRDFYDEDELRWV